MPITVSKLHANRVARQVEENLVGLQRDIARNARTHKAMAQAQSPALPQLRGFVTDCAARYRQRLQWLTSLRADATKRARLVDALQRIGLAASDLDDVATPIAAAVTALEAAPLNSYAEIAAACDALLDAVDDPPSLWPE